MTVDSWHSGATPGVTNYRGTVTNAVALPASGNTLNDMMTDTSTGSLYLWDGTTWVNTTLGAGAGGGAGAPAATAFFANPLAQTTDDLLISSLTCAVAGGSYLMRASVICYAANGGTVGGQLNVSARDQGSGISGTMTLSDFGGSTPAETGFAGSLDNMLPADNSWDSITASPLTFAQVGGIQAQFDTILTDVPAGDVGLTFYQFGSSAPGYPLNQTAVNTRVRYAMVQVTPAFPGPV